MIISGIARKIIHMGKSFEGTPTWRKKPVLTGFKISPISKDGEGTSNGDTSTHF